MLHRTTDHPTSPVSALAAACALAAVALGGACATNGNAPECHVGADCASGACGSNGLCVPVSSSSSGGDSGSPQPESGTVEASVEGGTETGPGGDAATGCKPTGSGTITRSEIPMMAGLHASFVIAENVTMNTAGTAQPDGSTDWDFTGALSGDHTVVITTDAPAGQWFASKFPSSTYTSKLSDTQTFLGVYQATASGLLLQGVVTPTNGSPQTDVSYSPAAEILQAPLQMGTTWASTSTVQGTLQGVPSTYTEKYDSKVDAHGTLKVPYGTFQVLRVQTTLTQTVGTVVNTTQSMAFVAECFGPVAKLTSKTTTFPQPVPGDAFTDVAEAWRLSP